MASTYIPIHTHTPPTDLSSSLLQNKQQQQQQQQQRTKPASARAQNSNDLLAFVQPSNSGNAPGDACARAELPFKQQHSSPPRAAMSRGAVMLSSTAVLCRGPAYEVGNTIVSSLESAWRRHGNACAITCNADAYALDARAFIDFSQVEACVRMYASETRGDAVVVECFKVSGDCLAYSTFWHELTACLRARGLVLETPIGDTAMDTQETCACSSDKLASPETGIFDMDAFEEELLEEMETDASGVSGDDVSVSSDVSDDEHEKRTERHVEKPHPFFDMAMSQDLRVLEEAAQLAARLAKNSHSKHIVMSPAGVSALCTILETAQACTFVGLCGVISIVYPVLCAVGQIAADHPRACVDAQAPAKLVCLLQAFLAPPKAKELHRFVSPKNGFETATRETLRCLLAICVSSHVSSIAAGGLRASLGELRDAVSAFGDTETRGLFDRLEGELSRK